MSLNCVHSRNALRGACSSHFGARVGAGILIDGRFRVDAGLDLTCLGNHCRRRNVHMRAGPLLTTCGHTPLLDPCGDSVCNSLLRACSDCCFNTGAGASFVIDGPLTVVRATSRRIHRCSIGVGVRLTCGPAGRLTLGTTLNLCCGCSRRKMFVPNIGGSSVIPVFSACNRTTGAIHRKMTAAFGVFCGIGTTCAGGFSEVLISLHLKNRILAASGRCSVNSKHGATGSFCRALKSIGNVNIFFSKCADT